MLVPSPINYFASPDLEPKYETSNDLLEEKMTKKPYSYFFCFRMFTIPSVLTPERSDFVRTSFEISEISFERHES